MDTTHHAEALERRHRDLDEEIRNLEASPSADSLEIVRMKKRKLTLKDEIHKFRS
jgi:hypothetical protein